MIFIVLKITHNGNINHTDSSKCGCKHNTHKTHDDKQHHLALWIAFLHALLDFVSKPQNQEFLLEMIKNL